MKKIGLVIGAIVCVAIMAMSAAMPAIVTAGSGQVTKEAGDNGSIPTAPAGPGNPVPIPEPTLPSAPAWEYALNAHDMAVATSIEVFEMPDYKAVICEKTYEAYRNLRLYQTPRYEAALDAIFEVMPGIKDWIIDDAQAEGLTDQMETLVALIFSEKIQQNPYYWDTTITPIYDEASTYSGYKDDYDVWGPRVGHYETVSTWEGWDMFWDAHEGGVPPAIPFGTETVLMAFMGLCPTSGYHIDITDIYASTSYSGAIVVEVERWGPGSGNVLQVITNPNHIVSIDSALMAESVVFVDAHTGNVIDVVSN
ncbi:MAG: protease complex subunit PrcB family protein [Methanobacteriota archaeon]